MFYSGSPIKEEQTYTGGTYLPALAGLQSNAQNQKYGLQQALAGVSQAQTGAAQGIYQNQINYDQQQNYYQQQLAAQKQQAAQQLAATSAKNTPSLQSVLGSAFSNYKSAKQGGEAFYTEHQIAPYLQAQLGLDYNTALKQAYDYRKQVYGE